ncbi:MAG: leucine--tRNA ligase [Candidatus Vogelbacteria bacterium]|nr:leucine--tRNA ligase [Candidatus Vogelbacteria bacterium]
MKSKTKIYDPDKIEGKWQKIWERSGIYKTKDGGNKPKCYILDMFPYPSGIGLHMGHPKGYVPTDTYSRYKKMNGYNVLHPMGWDAFGLPAENYAIKNKIHPAVSVKKNIKKFKEQLGRIGFDYDWSREIDTTDPKYYKWTQWIFLKLLEKGLAYESYEPINWCPSCQTGLANEDLDNGVCERCGSEVEKKPMRQWVLRITDYAERLLKDLDILKWPESVKESQRNWIGKSEGAEIDFKITNDELRIKVFTTHPETIFGATYLVLSPEHPLVAQLKDKIKNWKEVEKYILEARQKTEILRTAEGKEKTGVELRGITAINPANQKEIPVWMADYVLAHHETGSIMAVPAHDERDRSFAEKFKLPIVTVLQPLVTRISGIDAFKHREGVSERKAVVAVIKHWSEDKYLGVRWGNTGWQGFVIGGIENGENSETAGMREIVEETGYLHPKLVGKLGETVHARFWQNIKRQNRLAHFEPVLYELVDGERNEPTEEEKTLHKLSWLTPEEMCAFITHDDMAIIWNRVHDGHCKFISGCEVSSILVNSGRFDGLTVSEAVEEFEKLSLITRTTTYKLKDWVFSRQRYWGEPIPVIHCEKCALDNPVGRGVVPVSEKDLPVTLPKVKSYAPTGTGESPLADIKSWVNTKCPRCKGPGKRETNTMPQWAGSSWYYLRYMDPKNNKSLVDKKREKYWSPIDMYVGGTEHATRHLIYARFWHKFLFDIEIVNFEEPFTQLKNQGLVLAEDGRKMSKRWGNVIDPDGIVKRFGADALRVYIMFMGPFENAVAWQTNGVVGTRRFIERVWGLQNKLADRKSKVEESDDFISLLNRTIKKVGDDISSFSFNTAISAMMILINASDNLPRLSRNSFEKILKILAPFAPHIVEELWSNIGGSPLTGKRTRKSIHLERWPKYDESWLKDKTIKIAVQINGKVRDEFSAPADSDENILKTEATSRRNVKKWIDGKEIKKTIYVKGKLINIVVN